MCSEGDGDIPQGGCLSRDRDAGGWRLLCSTSCLGLGWELHPLGKRTFLRYKIAVFCLFLTVHPKRQNGGKAGMKNMFQIAE